MIKLVNQTIKSIADHKILSPLEIEKAKHIFETQEHVILSYGKSAISIQIENEEPINVQIVASETEDNLILKIDGSETEWDINGLVGLYIIKHDLKETPLSDGKKYTRKGMIHRVLEERAVKAKKANYKVKLANNLYGEHSLINEKGKSFKVTLWDFETKTGYIDNIDWKTNKLGTTKHILYLYNYLEENPKKTARLKKEFPFIEIYTDPLNDYKISWYFPEELSADEEKLINSYFGNATYIEDFKIASFFSFFQNSRDFQRIKIREEVFEKIETHFENVELDQLQQQTKLDYSPINATLYPYQKEGVAFSVFKKGVIIADEMGLGKTLQAITTAILKKDIFNFKRTLVICPASVKRQWQSEVLKFSNEKATVIEGSPEERNHTYTTNPDFFHIINYETVLRDLSSINDVNYDFVILDEAQKIKNYETKTAIAIKSIQKKHALVITGTPLENKLLDLYSIVQFLDQNLLAPQWEFSYQHCIFNTQSKNRIHGYYNLQNLKQRLNDILIRREKKDVFDQLPNVIQKNVYVSLSDEQASMHGSFASGIAKILGKKFKTTYDWQKLMLLLTNMRMVCDSSYLIDKQSHNSPKLVELRDILMQRLNIKNSNRKIIIFSEWVTMLNIIGDMLKEEGITYTMLTGKVPVKKRQELIKEFEANDDCKIFLSTESGGVGLNLQVADTVINFELPWNPAKKNQRIGRIDRIGQKKQTLHVFNLLSYDSIEMKIATGLLLKQNLFEGVLNENNLIDEVDFSEKGKSQFIQQLEEVVKEDPVNMPLESLNEEDDLIETETLLQENETEDVLEVESRYKEKESSKTNEHPIAENRKTTAPDFKQMEDVMTKGMEFLTGLYQMSTGKNLANGETPKVNVNKETGEVSISFKMDLNGGKS
ncbi:DEAD/DEAH box helicase [Algibacter sp. 2305UL17-15]|uniref:DEAD/DEAH box helicase n=1 Tax=Algibacter sp. 2305UL17-15 TaxID=3231268 RepID=UPI003458445D